MTYGNFNMKLIEEMDKTTLNLLYKSKQNAMRIGNNFSASRKEHYERIREISTAMDDRSWSFYI